MFQIGFFELVVVGLVALVVLGPERLPGAIRTMSLWIGRLRRSFNSIKTEIEKEIGADEIRRQLRNEEIMEKFRHTQSQVQNSISSIKKETDQFRKNVELEAQTAASVGTAPPHTSTQAAAGATESIASNVAAPSTANPAATDTVAPASASPAATAPVETPKP